MVQPSTPAELADEFGRDVVFPGPWKTLAEIKRANKAAGRFWFEPATLQFFRSIVHDDVYGGRLFISSEQFEASDGTKAPRTWSIRVCHDDGEIHTLDKRKYKSLNEAEQTVKLIVRGGDDLHHVDGVHRGTARSANGRVLERFERGIRAHLEDGHDHGASQLYPLENS